MYSNQLEDQENKFRKAVLLVSGAGKNAHHSGAPEFTLVFSGVRVVRSLVFCAMVRRSWSFCPISLSHCCVCPSSIYGF